jgi:hypothetical protein
MEVYVGMFQKSCKKRLRELEDYKWREKSSEMKMKLTVAFHIYLQNYVLIARRMRMNLPFAQLMMRCTLTGVAVKGRVDKPDTKVITGLQYMLL